MGAEQSNAVRISVHWRQIILLAVLVLLVWLPRGFGLDKFVATDEVAWLPRAANFYYDLSQRDFESSFRNPSPGLITLWVGTSAFLLEFPEYRGFGQGIFDKYPLFEEFLESKGVDPHNILVTSRVIMVLLNTIVIVLAFYFAWRLFGWLPALAGFFLIAFDPFHIAITQLAHLDGPMSSFIFLSLLAFLCYFWTGRRIIDLLVSASAGGLAVLAKLPGLVIIPTVGLIAIVSYFVTRKAKPPDKKEIAFIAQRLAAPLLFWGVIFTAAIVAFFPAAWTNPPHYLMQLFVSSAMESKTINIEALPEDDPAETFDISAQFLQRAFPFLTRSPDYYIRYPTKFLWRTTPVVLIGLLIGLVAFLRRLNIFNEKGVRWGVIGLIIFALVYTVFLSIPLKSSEKYYIPVYPVLDLLAGVGWSAGLVWVASFPGFAAKRYIPVVLLTGIVLFQAIGTLRTFPYYFTYFNPILGGSRKANELFSHGSGEGLNLAAEYLNAKPGAESFKVMSWYGIGPFSYYFDGEAVNLRADTWNEKLVEELKDTNYMVTYSNQWRRQIPNGLFGHLRGVNPEHTIWINGIEYARIYNVRDLPPGVYEPFILK